MQAFGIAVVVLMVAASAVAQNCNVANSSKIDCGFDGITQQQCTAKSCCWVPEGQNSIIPWCFFQEGTPAPPTPIPSSAPFNESEIALMYQYFVENLNIDGKGGVVASPDTDTPGGSYYYHWMRDAALCMRAFQQLNTFQDYNANMQAYVGWVLNAQTFPDPNGIDVRTEPKFFLPAGGVYTGGWCRPQTDGPALRSTTLMLYANELLSLGLESYVTQYLYTGSGGAFNGGAIKFDLDWVAANWQSSGCDLWEEVQSTAFAWNQMNFRRALYMGADFATRMGDTSTAATYLAAAEAVNASLPAHWDGQIFIEATIRPVDVASILGFNDGCMAEDPTASDYLCPGTLEAVATTAYIMDQFYALLAINTADTDNGVPGVMVGRYPGDIYVGGGAWILSTAACAEGFYRAALGAVRKGAVPEPRALAIYNGLFELPADAEHSVRSFAVRASNYGDGILDRIHYHVAGANFHLSEQLDRNTGVETSATDLSWSYANVLRACYWRNQLMAALDALPAQ